MSARFIAFSAFALFAAAGSTSVNAASIEFRKVPAAQAQPATPGLTLGYVALTKSSSSPRAIYVTSGGDLAAAANMSDRDAATTFSFSVGDRTPAAVIDLGKATKLRRMTTTFTSRGGKIDFFVFNALPGVDAGVQGNSDLAPSTLRVDDAVEARAVGSAPDTGSGRASVEFPETTARYVMVRWSPAQVSDNLIVAEVAAFGGSNDTANTERRTAVDNSDGKTMIDSKDVSDAKDVPAEGAEDVPAEGPAPGLPQPPPFVFVPALLPVSE